MHLFDLPVEVFILVLQLLESKELLRCATVCSQWKDVALDVKWKEHKVELVEMLRALGPVEPATADGQLFGFTTKHSSIKDALGTVGWRRLDELRRKVTRIRIRKPLVLNDISYLVDLQHAVDSSHQGFCPELRQLDVTLDGQSEPYAYDFLAGKSLVRLNLSWAPVRSNETPSIVASALERVALRSPLVEHIDTARFDSRFVNYGVFPNLRILKHDGDFRLKSWVKLCAECPLLERVRIWCLETVMDEDATYTPPEIQALPSLRALVTVETEDGMLGSSILRLTNMPRLRELEVTLKQRQPGEIETLVSLIKGRSPLLEKLRVRGPDLDWGSFSSFTGLRHLEFQGNIGSFTTEHVARIIRDIPNLVSLSMGSRSGDVDSTSAAFTISILDTIAEQCHQLLELNLPLNALSISWTSSPPTPACQFKTLRSLALDPLRIEVRAMEPFARYLARMCPDVDAFETIIFFSAETGTTVIPATFTEEELMESLFFKAKEAYEIQNDVSEGL